MGSPTLLGLDVLFAGEVQEVSFKMHNRVVKLLPVLLLATVGAVQAQTGSRSSISGSVSSPNGGALANTQIQITNLDTNQTNVTTSDAAGKYRFDDLSAGRYHLAARYGTGFASPTPEINVGQSDAVKVDLTVGSAGTTATAAPGSPVTSSEITPAPDLASPRLETGYNTRDADYLPETSFLARDGEAYSTYNLSLFPAGVTSNGGIGPARGPVVGGVRPTGNNFLIEGLDNNNRANPGPAAYISNEAIQEFQTQQNQFSPELGHAAGGEFNNIIRSGNNGFHGDLYEYFQNRNLDALDRSFAKQGILGNPRYDQNRMGGNFGFPIIHDKLFFFGDFEYIPLGFAALPGSPLFAPTAAGYATLGGLAGVSQTNLGVLRNALPTATTASSSVLVNGTQIPVGASSLLGRGYQNQYNGVGAMDWNAGANDKLQMRYVQNEIDANNSGVQLPSFYAPTRTRDIFASLAETHNFSGVAINELRLGYTRYTNDISPTSVNFPGLSAFPNIGIQDLGLTLGQGFYGPTVDRLNTFSLADNVHWTKGRHTFHFGADARRYTGPMRFLDQGIGAYTYSSLSGFLQNLPPDVSGVRTLGNLTFPTNGWDSYAYLKDDWKVTPNFDLSIGVRYEYVTIPLGVERQSLNAMADGGGLTFARPDPQVRNFAPQVGLAYSPGVDRNTVIRAGFGMYYDASTYLDSVPFLTPGLATSLYTSNLPAVPGFFGNGATPGAFFGPGATSSLTTPQALTTSYYPDQRIPYVLTWNASVEQTLLHKFVLTLRYLGDHGVHYPAADILNQGAPVVTAGNSLPLYYTAPSQAQLNGLTPTLASLQAQQAASNPLLAAGFGSPISSFNNGATSTYNALQVQGNERFSAGLQMVAAYTWSHLIDDVSPFVSTNPFFNMFALGPENSSIYDHRQRATVTTLWDVGALGHNGPGWVHSILTNMNIEGTYIYESAAPATFQSFLNGSLGGFTSSGVFVNPNGVPGTGSGVSPLLNSSGQTVAYLASNPNAQFVRGGPGSYAASPGNNWGFRPIDDFDASFVKRFVFHDRFNLEFRADAYNVFNHPQFTPGQLNNIGFSPFAAMSLMNFLTPGSASFGNPTEAFGSNPRMLQLALRLMF
jgi:hypothetical protein